MEVDVFAGLYSRKQGEVLRLQLGGVVQYCPRIEASFRNGHIIFDAWWVTRNESKYIRGTVKRDKICLICPLFKRLFFFNEGNYLVDATSAVD